MPLISYICECKNSTSKYYRQAKESPACLLCGVCGKDMKKSLSAPSTSSKISVDNGVQARAVEIDPNIIAINRERSEKDYREK
jgi:hypothetical protein